MKSTSVKNQQTPDAGWAGSSVASGNGTLARGGQDIRWSCPPSYICYFSVHREIDDVVPARPKSTDDANEPPCNSFLKNDRGGTCTFARHKAMGQNGNMAGGISLAWFANRFCEVLLTIEFPSASSSHGSRFTEHSPGFERFFPMPVFEGTLLMKMFSVGGIAGSPSPCLKTKPLRNQESRAPGMTHRPLTSGDLVEKTPWLSKMCCVFVAILIPLNQDLQIVCKPIPFSIAFFPSF